MMPPEHMCDSVRSEDAGCGEGERGQNCALSRLAKTHTQYCKTPCVD